MLFDTHAHLNLSAYRNDAETVIRRALHSKVGMIIPGLNYKSSKRALELANKFLNNVYVAIGLHPLDLEDHEEKYGGEIEAVRGEEFNLELYQQLARFDKVVAVGEIGLDYFLSQHKLKTDLTAVKQKQRQNFLKQLEFAARQNLPAIIHCRQAHDDMLEVLTAHRIKQKEALSKNRPWGVMHCFSGDENLAWEYFNLGLMISFTGVITFSKQWDDLIRKMPDDKLMLETDSPFMSPEPYRGRRNEPLLVKYVAQRIAEIKNWSLEHTAKITTANVKKLFQL